MRAALFGRRSRMPLPFMDELDPTGQGQGPAGVMPPEPAPVPPPQRPGMFGGRARGILRREDGDPGTFANYLLFGSNGVQGMRDSAMNQQLFGARMRGAKLEEQQAQQEQAAREAAIAALPPELQRIAPLLSPEALAEAALPEKWGPLETIDGRMGQRNPRTGEYEWAPGLPSEARPYSPPVSGTDLGLGPGMFQQSPQGRYEPVNTQRGSPLERAQATADVQRVDALRNAADTDAATAAELNRFAGINAQEPTGPNNPQALGIGGWRPFANSDTQQMVQIISRLTPQQRVPGSGATSDFDARMFQEALPGINRAPEANSAIVEAYRARAVLANERVNMAEAWLEGGSLSGFDGVWRRYVQANPIFDPQSNANNPRINPRRQDFMTWAQENGIEIGAPASAQMRRPSTTPAPSAPTRPPVPGTVEDGFRFRGGNPADPNNWEPVR